MAQMDGWDGFVVARYLGLWRHDTVEGYDGRVPVVTHHQLSRSQRPKQFPPYFTDSSASLPGREGIATQGDHREDRVSEGPGRDLENRDGGSGRENLGRGQRLDRVTVGRPRQTIYSAMPLPCAADETGQGPAVLK